CAERRLVYMNQCGAGFKEVGLAMGGALALHYCSRGAAFGDFDNDGDVDVLLNNIDRAPTLLRNDIGDENNWLRIKTIGRTSNRNGIGCRITISTGTKSQTREIKSGGSYLSSSDLRAHFGLGGATKVDLLNVRWPGGRIQVLRDVPANQTVTVQEG